MLSLMGPGDTILNSALEGSNVRNNSEGVVEREITLHYKIDRGGEQRYEHIYIRFREVDVRLLHGLSKPRENAVNSPASLAR
jgi:hypothetical protein